MAALLPTSPGEQPKTPLELPDFPDEPGVPEIGDPIPDTPEVPGPDYDPFGIPEPPGVPEIGDPIAFPEGT